MSTDWDLEPSTSNPPASDTAPAGVEVVAEELLQDPGVQAALVRLKRAEVAAGKAAAALARAVDALADADGLLEVRRAKVDDFENDPKKLPWQRLAAGEDVEKAQRAVERWSKALTACEADVAATGADVDQAEHDAAEAFRLAAATPPPAADEPTLVYGSVDEFVREYLRHLYSRASDNRIWCARWWEVDEAVVRLEALWRSWEFLRLDPTTGMSVWWRDHADHHMNVLFSSTGPFAGYVDVDGDPHAEDNHLHLTQPLPYVAPPVGMFPDVREPKK